VTVFEYVPVLYEEGEVGEEEEYEEEFKVL
jgi:hypothetical protein